MILLDTQCPYGAGECPKIKTIYDMLETNRNEVKELSKTVTELTTTIRNASYVLGIAVAIICALIGVMVI